MFEGIGSLLNIESVTSNIFLQILTNPKFLLSTVITETLTVALIILFEVWLHETPQVFSEGFFHVFPEKFKSF
jgi:hypothetical protein